MLRNMLSVLASLTIVAVSAPLAVAQTSDISASSPKETQRAQRKAERAQRKAERKAAHAKSAAELNTLEKNGYQPGNNALGYPQNIQNTEKKAGGGQPASAPLVHRTATAASNVSHQRRLAALS